MAIELALSPKEASFAMLMLEVDATGSEVKVVALEPFASSSAFSRGVVPSCGPPAPPRLRLRTSGRPSDGADTR